MTKVEIDKALRKLPTALKSDCKYYDSEWVLPKGKCESEKRRYLVSRECIFRYFFNFNDESFEINLIICTGRQYFPTCFHIYPYCNDKKILFNHHIIQNDDFDIVKALFYKEISIDEFLDYFKVDRKIFDKEQQ